MGGPLSLVDEDIVSFASLLPCLDMDEDESYPQISMDLIVLIPSKFVGTLLTFAIIFV